MHKCVNLCDGDGVRVCVRVHRVCLLCMYVWVYVCVCDALACKHDISISASCMNFKLGM